MFCKYCGHKISDNAKFCDKCGKKITEDQPVSRICPYCAEPLPRYAQMCRNCLNDIPEDGQPVKPKKQKKKRGPIGCLVWAAIILIVFGSCSAAIFGDDPEPASESEPVSTYEITGDTIVEPQKQETTESLDSIAESIKSILNNHFENNEVSYDETGLTASITADGMALIGTLASSDNAEMIDDWNQISVSISEISGNFAAAFHERGFAQYTVTVIVKNDQDPENILLMAVNGELVYDAVNTEK